MFNEMMRRVHRVARCDLPVLLIGESGTGKDLVARAIHAASDRVSGMFVPLDCSTLGETLFESELFGHERGSFTGADRAKAGLLDLADGGTLFLDEVGNLPRHLQAKLLRLIETCRYRRVGSTKERRCDFRLISATNMDLDGMVRDGRFRLDLYYRLAVFPIRLPPLRERHDDVPLLIEALRRRIGCQRLYSDAAIDILARYDYPGNVRELVNILQQTCLVADGSEVSVHDLPSDVCPARDLELTSPCSEERITPLSEVEDRYLRWAAARHRGSRAKLAQALGMNERTLYRRLKRIADNSSRTHRGQAYQ